MFAFLGPNGAGKTTTVEILEGLRRLTDGKLTVLGLDPWTQGTELHRQIGVIPQDFRFFDKTTPTEAIVYYGALFGVRPDPPELLQRVGLSDKASARFDTLSGGQKQKLGGGRTGLDPQARRGIRDVIRQLRKEGRTVFLTTHYLEEAELLADQVAIIHHGKIIAEGTPTAIIAEHGRADHVLVQAAPAMADLLRQRLGLRVTIEGPRLDIELRNKGDVLKVLSTIDASGIPWEGFATKSETLEDVFVHLVGRMDEGTLKPEAEGTA
ncbi:MAG: ABC transporter ATP-binding protein [Thermoplasmata archaeon]|nr:ABC transporter ATP-binding protein [Thermoplasmata archaeon]